jgi:hypothetical protein
MQNAKFNPEQITYVSFFPTNNNPITPTFIKEKVLVEDPKKFAEGFTTGPGLLLLEQKGKKRSFVQHFWLEPGEPVPVEEPTQEPTQDQEQPKDEIQVKKPTSKKPTAKKQPV